MTEIGRQNDVSVQAIKYWMNKHGVEHRATLQDVLFEASPTLSYVFGVLHGDGFLYYNPANKHHHIFLTVVDKPFADSFAAALARLGLRSTLRVEPARNKSQPQWKVWVASSKFHELWNGMSPTARLDVGLMYERDFIRGVYESEGSVKLHRGSLEMTICSTNVVMLRRIESCMKAKGYAPKWFERTLESGKSFVNLDLYRQLEIKRFIAWIAPCIKYQPRGYAYPEASQDGDVLEAVETTKDN